MNDFKVEPGLLHFGSHRSQTDGFDRRDATFPNRPDRQPAGTYGLATQVHRACTALSYAATEFRSRETEYVAKNHASLTPQVYDVPKEIDEEIAALKLRSMGVGIDVLTEEQKAYLASWESGTA